MDTSRLPDLTPEQLVDIEVPQDVRISPSGKHCVYACKPIARKGEHTVSSLWIAELGKEHSARQLTSGMFNDSAPQWCPDISNGECIAFISDRAKQGESSAIYMLSISGGEAYPVTKADKKKKIPALKWSPNGQYIAFLSPDEKTEAQEAKDKETEEAKVYGERWEYNRLRLLHVATREISTLVTMDAHVTDFTWSVDSKDIAYITQQTPEVDSAGYHGAQFYKSSLAIHKSEILGEQFPGPARDLAWSGPTLFFLAGYTPDKSSTSCCVYEMSASTGQWSRHSYGESDCAFSLRSFTYRSRQYIAVHVLDVLMDWIPTYLQRYLNGNPLTTPNNDQSIEAWDCSIANGRMLKVIGYSTASEPTEIYSVEEGKFCQLSNHGHGIAKLNIGEAKPIYCEAQDGSHCDGIFVRPINTQKDKPIPTVVLVHGGPYSRINVAFNLLYFYWGPMLTSAGYGVLCPNYSGGSGHGESYAAEAQGGMGTKDYDDIITLLKEGIKRGLIDADRVVIGGYSQGGFLSYLAVTRSDFTFRGAICGAGVSDMDMLTMTSDAPWFEAEIAGSAPWISSSDDTKSRHGSAIWYMKNVKTPILILHGEEDERVPLSQAVAFHRGCLHYGVPCEFVTYPREKHRMEERAHVIDMLRRIRRFVDLQLK
ncbi:acylaminoacyl-peptidase, partial [Lecanoromycetidae sp. Uapishka_2]